MRLSPEDAQFQKRSFSLKGHKTSVSLEKAFWQVLEDAAKTQGVSLAHLVTEVDEKRSGSLASALRLYVLRLCLKILCLHQKNSLFQPSSKHPSSEGQGENGNESHGPSLHEDFRGWDIL